MMRIYQPMVSTGRGIFAPFIPASTASEAAIIYADFRRRVFRKTLKRPAWAPLREISRDQFERATARGYDEAASHYTEEEAGQVAAREARIPLSSSARGNAYAIKQARANTRLVRLLSGL